MTEFLLWIVQHNGLLTWPYKQDKIAFSFISMWTTDRAKPIWLQTHNSPCLPMQFIWDPFAIPFPLKYDRCSLAAEVTLTSMKSAVDIHHPWNSILGLNERSLVFLQESFKQSRFSTGTQSTAAWHSSILDIGAMVDYLQTITQKSMAELKI